MNRIKNKSGKNKSGEKLKLLVPGTTKLSGRTKKDVGKDKDRKNLPKLESVEIVLVYCNLVKNNYQHTSKVFFPFLRNKQFG